MALLVAVLASYLDHIFLGSILFITRVIIVWGSIYQVYPRIRNAGRCTTGLLVATIALSFSKVFIRKRNTCQGYKLGVSWLGLVFFFKRLESFLFFIGPLALSTTRIHFTNIGGRLEHSFALGLNGLIKHFVAGVQLLMPAIYMSLDRRL